MSGEDKGLIVLVLGFVAFLYLVGWLHARPKRRRAKEERRRFVRQFEGRYLFDLSAPCLGGLGLPAETLCRVVFLTDGLMLGAAGQQYTLPLERLTEVRVMTRTEAQEQYVDNRDAIAADVMVFGPSGAYYSPPVVKKTEWKKRKYLAVAYVDRDSGEPAFLLFDAGGLKSGQTRQIREYGQRLRQKPAARIEL